MGESLLAGLGAPALFFGIRARLIVRAILRPRDSSMIHVKVIEEQSMNRKLAALGFATVGAIALPASPAAAQQQRSQEIQVYGGEIFGDRLTETPISGSTPRLDDSATVGARYNYNYTDMWGVQLSAGYSPSHASHVASGNGRLGLTTVDLDGVWNIMPDLKIADFKIVPYAVAGVGYAWANLDRAIQGSVGTRAVSITDSNGYTANAGLGAKYYVTDNLFVDFGGRYRYLSRLVSYHGMGMNTVETSLGVGWRF
jgi:opacity protein-like surface antigen